MSNIEGKKKRKDPRTEIIPAIWGITAGILGICIPLSAVTHSGPLIPVLALIGATVSSCVVWLTRSPQQEAPAEIEGVLAQLSQRVAQLEIDTRDIELRYSIEQSARGPQQEPVSRATSGTTAPNER